MCFHCCVINGSEKQIYKQITMYFKKNWLFYLLKKEKIGFEITNDEI